MSTANALVVPAPKKHTATLIFLHGLGDTGAGWASVSENFRLRRKFEECAFIFPNAPSIPISVNMGMKMPGWFDLASLSDIYSKEDEEGMNKSVETVHGIIDHHMSKGVPSERIIVGGFSQGGAIAILAGLSCKHKLGGIIALSTWLPLREKLLSLRTEANKDIKFFQAHGEMDYVVRYDWGEKTRDTLKGTDFGHEVEFHSYPSLDHSADPQEITAMEIWLERQLKKTERILKETDATEESSA